jgi:anaerobic magnesium-protoporphyrin IX monomethyl ester cyclase
MKVMLIFPPQFDPTMPNLALPCLTAMLRSEGHEVVQRDLNVEAYDILLSRRELERAAAKIDANYNSLLFLGADSGELNRLLKISRFLTGEVEHAKGVIRDIRDFLDYQRYARSKKVLADSLALISQAYFGTRLSLESYKMFYSPFATGQVLQAVQAPDYNLYHDFYLRYAIPAIRAAAPRVLGISIATHNQVIPGLTLAHLVKQALPGAHIVIGGKYFTILRDNLVHNEPLFTLFDSVVIHEGEIALAQLVRCLEYQQDLSRVPNLIYKDGSKIIATEPQRIENLDSLPTPSFAGLPLHLYFSPVPVLPAYASRGCYWRKCAFCSLGDTMDRKYTVRGAALVRADLEKLARQHHCSYFVFIDEAISPHYLRQFAEGMAEAGLDIRWGTHIRFENELNREWCAALAQSGCRALFFGLESACDRVLALINKGTHPAIIKQVLAASNEAGIISQVSCFFGFPTETLAEAKETMQFILENAPYISATLFGYYNLMLDSRTYIHPGDYQIKKVVPVKGHDLSPILNYEVGSGLTPQEAFETAQLFAKVLETLGYQTLKNAHLVILASHYRTNNLLWLTAAPWEKLFGKKRFIKNRLRKARRTAAALFHDPALNRPAAGLKTAGKRGGHGSPA